MTDEIVDALKDIDRKSLETSDVFGKRIHSKVAERIAKNPFKTFAFSTPISTYSQMRVSLDIGGVHALRIAHVEIDGDNPYIMILSGEAQEINERYAAAIIERQIKRILGLSIAQGLAQPGPVRVSVLPNVRISGGIEERIPPGSESLIVYCEPPVHV